MACAKNIEFLKFSAKGPAWSWDSQMLMLVPQKDKAKWLQLMEACMGLGGSLCPPFRGEALRLAEPVLVNCTGYGAKALWGADELVPVRGQINWMPAQPNAGYGLYFQDVYVLSRGDGLVVQYTGPTDDYGYGVDDETPDPDEMRRAVRTVAPLFQGWQV